MITEEKKKILELFAEGRKFYKLMQFDQARQRFVDALEIDAEDGPSKVYLARCKHYMDNPPADDWDGVFVMTTK